jgi:hypothetical protein
MAIKARHEEHCGSVAWADDSALERFARVVIAAFLTEEDDQPLCIAGWTELHSAQEDWDELGDRPPDGSYDADDPLSTKRWIVVVSNSSERPIFDCHVILRAPHGPLKINALEFGTVAPGARRWPMQTWNVQVPGNVVSGLTTRVLFTDARAQHWERTDDGMLAALDERPADVAQREFTEYVERSQGEG